VIGPNGAGKTTLLCAAMGLLPSTGSLSIDGKLVPRPTVEAMVARGVALVPERRELFGEMTVEDNLLLGGFYRWRKGHRDQKARMQEVFEIFPRMSERRLQIASTLSGGERQMLAIGRALMARPKLLMLDEPSLGLAPLIVREVLKVVSALRQHGISVLLVEQNARAALQVADRGYVLEMGSVALSGPARDLLHDRRIIDTYLGIGSAAPAKKLAVPNLNHLKENTMATVLQSHIAGRWIGAEPAQALRSAVNGKHVYSTHGEALDFAEALQHARSTGLANSDGHGFPGARRAPQGAGQIFERAQGGAVRRVGPHRRHAGRRLDRHRGRRRHLVRLCVDGRERAAVRQPGA
jgi:branched-chain amino acid transport system ATP-binding protein